MRKQTKLVAVLSAAALLAMGASMTSFAAGWEKDDAGVWHYYDSDDEMVTGEWKKDGGKWFYLDDDGNMLTDSWVDDDYYVAEDGHMLTNEWKKTVSDDDQDDPDEDGESWYYFGSKGKKTIVPAFYEHLTHQATAVLGELDRRLRTAGGLVPNDSLPIPEAERKSAIAERIDSLTGRSMTARFQVVSARLCDFPDLSSD